MNKSFKSFMSGSAYKRAWLRQRPIACSVPTIYHLAKTYSYIFKWLVIHRKGHDFCLNTRYSRCSSVHRNISFVFFSCDQAALQMVFSVRLSVRLSHLFDYVHIIVSSWNFQELLPMTKVRSMQKVKVRGQRSRSQWSQPNLTVSGL